MRVQTREQLQFPNLYLPLYQVSTVRHRQNVYHPRCHVTQERRHVQVSDLCKINQLFLYYFKEVYFEIGVLENKQETIPSRTF